MHFGFRCSRLLLCKVFICHLLLFCQVVVLSLILRRQIYYFHFLVAFAIEHVFSAAQPASDVSSSSPCGYLRLEMDLAFNVNSLSSLPGGKCSVTLHLLSAYLDRI